jgi:RHS repeat-associated protein
MNLGYTGKAYDEITGLYNYGYRDYAPVAARFTTVDPIRDGANWFSYVNNDPVNWLDLWGLSASDKQNSKSLMDEFNEAINLTVGLQVSAGFNIPGIVSVDASLNLMSTSFENGTQTHSSGITLGGSIGNE